MTNEVEEINAQPIKEEQDYTGTAMAGFVLSIISWVLGGMAGIVLAIIALVLSVKSRKVNKMPFKVFNIIGLVLSIVSLSFNVIYLIYSLIMSFIAGTIAIGSIIGVLFYFVFNYNAIMKEIGVEATALLPFMLI